MASASDRELLERAKGGDAEAFGLIVRRHQKRIFRLAAHLTRSSADAEDITQETFVRAFKAVDRFDGRSEPFTWLYRIAVNLSLNLLRSRKTRSRTMSEGDPRLASLLSEGVASPTAGPGKEAELRAHVEALLEGIDGLSETLRTTLVLVNVDGLSHEEAAQVLGCPEGTVAWRVHEARRKLREFLAARGYDQGGYEEEVS